MGKLQKKPKWSPKRKRRSAAKRPQDDVLIIHPNPNPTPEQIARSEALGRFLEEKRRKIAAMTPEQKRKADQDWEKFKKTINEGRYRKVILD
jgi:hypothetical protein